MNIHLLMDPRELLQQQDESLECHHSHILLYSGNMHKNNWSCSLTETGLLMGGLHKKGSVNSKA